MTHKRPTHYLKAAILCALTCALVLVLMGCGTMPCPRMDTGQVRNLKIVLVVDHLTDIGSAEVNESTQEYSKDDPGQGSAFLLGCGQQWFEQTGIRLEIVETIKIKQWTESDLEGSVKELQGIISHIDPQNYDMAIGIGMSLGSTLGAASAMFVPMPIWVGVIEDDFRRYMRLKTLECWVFQHELAHAFIFETEHSSGLLSSFTVFSTGNTCLLEKDFNELMKNKFRDFNEPVIYK